MSKGKHSSKRNQWYLIIFHGIGKRHYKQRQQRQQQQQHHHNYLLYRHSYLLYHIFNALTRGKQTIRNWYRLVWKQYLARRSAWSLSLILTLILSSDLIRFISFQCSFFATRCSYWLPTGRCRCLFHNLNFFLLFLKY